jgi:Mn-dependent DtxR family transcriptional regulator
MAIRDSSEDYLKMMYTLQIEKGYIRSIDVAAGLGVTKPSVSYAVKRLKEAGMITMESSGEIHLTDSGLAVAKKTYDRHQALTSLLMYMGVEEERACEDACKIEHDISDETFEALMKFAEGKVPSMHHAHHHYHLKKK